MSKTILVVEDDLFLRELIKLSLQHGSDFEVILAKNGTEAINLSLEKKPDLILMDVMIQPFDGFTICKKIKKTPQIANIPVVMLTAHRGREIMSRAVRAGVVEVINKPFDPLALGKKIKSILTSFE